MQRITGGISGHQFVPDVYLHDLGDGQVNRQKRQVTDESQPFRTALRGAGQRVRPAQPGW